MQSLILLADFGLAAAGASIRAGGEAVVNNPLTSVGWLAGIMAALKLLHKQFPNTIPDIIGYVFKALPDFFGKNTLEAALKRLYEQLVADGVEESEALAQVESVMKSVSPKLETKRVSKFCKSMKSLVKAPAPVPVQPGE